MILNKEKKHKYLSFTTQTSRHLSKTSLRGSSPTLIHLITRDLQQSAQCANQMSECLSTLILHPLCKYIKGQPTCSKSSEELRLKSTGHFYQNASRWRRRQREISGTSAHLKGYPQTIYGVGQKKMVLDMTGMSTWDLINVSTLRRSLVLVGEIHVEEAPERLLGPPEIRLE